MREGKGGGVRINHVFQLADARLGIARLLHAEAEGKLDTSILRTGKVEEKGGGNKTLLAGADKRLGISRFVDA